MLVVEHLLCAAAGRLDLSKVCRHFCVARGCHSDHWVRQMCRSICNSLCCAGLCPGMLSGALLLLWTGLWLVGNSWRAPVLIAACADAHVLNNKAAGSVLPNRFVVGCCTCITCARSHLNFGFTSLLLHPYPSRSCSRFASARPIIPHSPRPCHHPSLLLDPGSHTQSTVLGATCGHVWRPSDPSGSCLQ